MIRLSTQFDRAVTRPIVAAPKSSGCCCCCCCCIVTVVGFSVVTARSTYRALGPGAKPTKKQPAKPVMDGWSTRPVEGAPPAAPPEPEPPPAAEEHPFGAPDRMRWVALGALLLPLSLCIVPGILAGVAEVISNRATTELGSRAAELVPTGITALLFVGLIVLLRRSARWGALGIGLTSALMAVAIASAFFLDAYFAAPLVLSVTMYVGGLVALARRGVPRTTLIIVGASLPFALALELAAWLGIFSAA